MYCNTEFLYRSQRNSCSFIRIPKLNSLRTPLYFRTPEVPHVAIEFRQGPSFRDFTLSPMSCRPPGLLDKPWSRLRYITATLCIATWIVDSSSGLIKRATNKTWAEACKLEGAARSISDRYRCSFFGLVYGCGHILKNRSKEIFGLQLLPPATPEHSCPLTFTHLLHHKHGQRISNDAQERAL